MAGGTHIFDMIKRLKENENLKKKGYFKSKGSIASSSQQVLQDSTTASPEALAEIRARAIQEQQEATKRSIIILLVSAVLALIAVAVFLVFF